MTAARYARTRPNLRINPATSSAQYGLYALRSGQVPHLRDTHGPDAGQETYDAVCRDLGMDPLGWRRTARVER